ncbi:MAG: ABC transporter permease subunit [Myxococcota bacterium]
MIALLRLEAAGVLRTRVAVVSVAAAAALVGLFVALASRESAIVSFTGFGRVITGTGLAALLFLPLLSMFSTVQSVVAARQQGVLEWYLSHPVSRDAAFLAMLVPRLVAVAGPALAAVLGLALAALGFGEPVGLAAVARLAAILVGQALCFGALGMWISVGAPSVEQALVRGVGLWLTCAMVLDFALVGAMLRWRLPPHLVFAISAIDPIQAGRLGLLAGADAELGVLGPVGTWVTTTFGGTWTTVYAIGWPLALAALAGLAARRAFVRRDLHA